MYLVGCYLSLDPELKAAEPYYLARTRQLLADSLGKPGNHSIQWLQASCLLAFYLWKNCRFLEAKQEASHKTLMVLPVSLFNRCSNRHSLLGV